MNFGKLHRQGANPEYQQEYRQRSGIEVSISQAVRGFGMRRSRYVGEIKKISAKRDDGDGGQYCASE